MMEQRIHHVRGKIESDNSHRENYGFQHPGQPAGFRDDFSGKKARHVTNDED
mgnify:CR=1 FL=1